MERAIPDYSHLYRELNQESSVYFVVYKIPLKKWSENCVTAIPLLTLKAFCNGLQVGERMRLDQMEFSEVMVIHRMFLKSPDLDIAHLDGADKVKCLYVFADVVELGSAGQISKLPGSIMVVIMCRFLIVDSNWLSMQYRFDFPHMRLHAILEPQRARIHRRNPDSVHDDYPVITISANVIRFSGTRMSFGIGPFLDPSMIISSERHSIVEGLSRGSTCTVGPVEQSSPIMVDPDGIRVQCEFNWVGSGIFAVAFDGAPEGFSLFQRDLPDLLLLDPNILLCMQTSMLVAELVEFSHPSSDIHAAVTEHVVWLNTHLLQALTKSEGTSSYDDYLALIFRAQYLLKGLGRARSLVVPQLQYDVYRNLINQMARVAESYDQSLKQLQLFLVQNKVLGGYLLEQNRAFAAKERDMEVFHSELIAQKKLELQNTMFKMDQLSSQMETQIADMDQAKEDMDAGLRRFQNRQVANAMFAVFRAIGAIALTALTGGAAAPAAMTAAKGAVSIAGQAARGLERVLEILDNLQAAMEVFKIIKDLVESLREVGQLVNAPEMPDMPTEADWSIFVNEVEGVAEQMPEEVSEVSAWKTSCKNVAAVGRELMTTSAYISQLQYDIKVQAMLQDIANKQADRLSSIQAADLSSYTEMVTQMDMRTTRLLMELIKVLDMQNAALMYQFLTLPAPMNTWPVTMETVWGMLVQHEHAAVLGLMRLGPAFDFRRTFMVKEIPVDLLLHGEDWQFEIPVNELTVFPGTWSQVRIHHLEMKFVGTAEGSAPNGAHQPITESGEVYILLQGSRVFHDRNKTELLHYEAAVPLDYHYAYHLKTGETTLSNSPSNDFIRTFMRMTPFTTWRLRVSASAQENQGLAFPTTTIGAGDTTQIAVTFYVSAIREISL